MEKAARILIILFLLISCEENDSNETIISSGTSFGLCGGYCIRKMVISSEVLSYTATSWDSVNYPTLEYRSQLNSVEWNDLIPLVEMPKLQEFEDIIGCPDCADGGAEWIKVESSEGSEMITFEYNSTPN